MNDKKTHHRPKFSLEFKQDAVKLVIEKGYSQRDAAEYLGISQSALGRWVQAERKTVTADSSDKRGPLNLAEQDELRRLHILAQAEHPF